MNKNRALILLSATILLTACGVNNSYAVPTPQKSIVAKPVIAAQVSKNVSQIDELLSQGKYSEAQKQAEDVLAANPNDLHARVRLAKSYASQFKLDAANREYSKILEKDPKNSQAYNGLGLVYYRKTTSSNMEIIKNKKTYFEQAIKAFEDSIKYDPSNYEAYNNAGNVYKELGQVDKAERYYEKAMNLEPKVSDTVSNIGSIYFSKNQVDAAIEKYREAIQLNSKNSSAYYRLGEALIAKGEYSKAINYLQTALYLNTNSAPVHNMLGKAYELQGNEAAALTEYKKAILIKPEYTQAYLSISNIYQNRNDGELAISELRNALSANPNFIEGKMKIADISLELGKVEQAIKYYKDSVIYSSYSERAVQGLAKAYFKQAQMAKANDGFVSDNDYEQAEDSIINAIQYNPNDLQLYLALLRVSRITDNGANATYYLNQIVKNPVSKPIDYIIRGEAYAVCNKYNDAMIEFRKSISNANTVGDVLSLGEIFTVNREFPAAEEAYAKALIMSPQNHRAKRSLRRIADIKSRAKSQYNVAQGFDGEGQHYAAIEGYLESISINPTFADARLALGKVFEKKGYYSNALEQYTAYVNLIKPYDKDYFKYQNKIKKLGSKVERLAKSTKPLKKYTRL